MPNVTDIIKNPQIISNKDETYSHTGRPDFAPVQPEIQDITRPAPKVYKPRNESYT